MTAIFMFPGPDQRGGIYHNLSEFNGKPVVDFDITKGIEDPVAHCYRMRAGGYEEEYPEVAEQFTAFANDERAGEVTEFVIGCWDPNSYVTSEAVRDTVIREAAKLPNVEAIMFGDISFVEHDVFAIENVDPTALIDAFPKLVEYRERNGHPEPTRFAGLHHDRLKKLVVEGCALPATVVSNIIEADLPNLEHLDIWIGMKLRGGAGNVRSLDPLLDGTVFPKLEYLGLRNTAMTNKIVKALLKRSASGAPSILDRLHTLDLSLGVLKDQGAKALFENPAIQNLDRLILFHHFVSDAWVEKLKELPIEVDLAHHQEPDEDGDRLPLVY